MTKQSVRVLTVPANQLTEVIETLGNKAILDIVQHGELVTIVMMTSALQKSLEATFKTIAEDRKREARIASIPFIKTSLHPRYITGYKAVYIQDGKLIKEVFTQLRKAQEASILDGRTPKRIEAQYCQYRLSGELMNGEQLVKMFKREQDAQKFLAKVTLEKPKIVRVAY